MDPLTRRRVEGILPTDRRVQDLIVAHLDHSWDATPQTSNHTMSAADMAADGVELFAIFENDIAVGVGGLKDLGQGEVEVKSVHVAAQARGKGVARDIMTHLQHVARANGAKAMDLETGSDLLPEYDAARRLYERLGFEYCGPIFGYTEDPNSVFMRLLLEPHPETPQ